MGPRDEPLAPSVPQPPAVPATPSVLVTPPPPQKPQRTLFAGEPAGGRDALGIDETLAHLAELAVHRGTQGTLCIGLLGGAGSGKSFAVGRLATRIRELATAAGRSGGSPFVSKVHIQTLDAASLDGDPTLALAARLHAGLRQPYPELAREIGATARDPHTVLREANEKLDDARRRLDSERRALDDAGSRRARLTETVLYEAAGSQVDAYARANRAGIESRLTSFGLAGEPVRTYKDLVQLVSGSGGTVGLALRSLWAFKGQTKLIIAALVLFAVGIGLGIAIDDQTTWLGSLRGGPKGGAPVADWFEAHMGLLSTARTGTYLLGVLALVANVLRAVNFLRPILKGARLLETDLDARRIDLDGLYAHQSKRVDALDGDVERLTAAVTEAERRVGTTSPGAASEPSPFEMANGAAQGQTIFATLAGLMSGAPSTTFAAPERVILALDHLDALPPERARALLDALHRAAGPGLVTLVGTDPARLDPFDQYRGELARWIQVPLRLHRAASKTAHHQLVHDALGHGDPSFVATKVDSQQSDLDASIDDEEASLLIALAELAGHTPRAVRRFANLYLLARLGEDRRLAILAFMLAAAQGATPDERQAITTALAGEPGAPFDLSQGSQRLRDGLATVVAIGGRVNKGDAAEAARRADTFAITPLVA